MFAASSRDCRSSSANVNFSRLRYIAERAAIGEQKEALFAVEIPERRGSFLQFCEAIGKRNVTEFNYRFQDAGKAHIFVGLELRKGPEERQAIAERLEDAGYKVMDLSDDELAKTHLRHMVGGAAPAIEHEQIYRFEFPEKPGALLAFLQAVGKRWNISLFHYRNHGADYGRVLAGVQVPPEDRADFDQHLQALGYHWYEESANPAYRMFLG